MDEGPTNFATELKKLRAERGISQPALAKRIRVSRALVSLWEISARTPCLAQVEAIDEALNAGGTLAETYTSTSGLDFGHSWEESCRAVVNLWRHDAARRTFIRSAAFNAAALVAPLAGWLSEDAATPTGDGTKRVGTPEVATIATMTQAFRGLDNRYGGAHARDAVVAYLDAEVSPMLKHGHYSAKIRGDLLSRTAELTQLAGWMSYDAGMHGIAQRYFVQALRLAKSAADARLGIEILAGMAHQAAFLGHARQAADLGEAAMRSAAEIDAPALEAEAATMTAHGHALMTDSAECARLLAHAEQRLDGAERWGDPQWFGYFDAAYLAAKTGHCLLAAGDQRPATAAARRSLDMDGNYVRGRMFNLYLLATTLAKAGEPEEACHHATEALALGEDIRSARADIYREGVCEALHPYGGLPEVQAFVESCRAASS